MSNNSKSNFEKEWDNMEKALQEVELKKKSLAIEKDITDHNQIDYHIHSHPFIPKSTVIELVTRVFLVEPEVAKQLDKLAEKMSRGRLETEINELLKELLKRQE
ncbi:hypothetical protein [Paenibacillus sp. 2KB_22]|uniref:hypothetical protein n=1 Tax=Paenibacillus sp. 2KB_22 TaxID=3232978 RepID=UPI003F964E94